MCNFCGEADGCKYTAGTMGEIPELTADDWKAIYLHIRYSHLPFMHSIIVRAKEREGITFTPSGRAKRSNQLEMELP